jgi:hypothetical protein
MRNKFEGKKNLFIGIGVALVIILILIIWNPFKSNDAANDDSLSDNETSVLQKEALNTNEEEEVQKTEVVSEPKNKEVVYSKSGLCEDYVMTQGQTLKVDDHDVTLIKIGKSSIRIKVDEKEVIMSGSDEQKIEGLNIVLNEELFLYFAEDDEDNRVQLRIGCSNDELSEEKHILLNLQTRGESICKALTETCEQEFGTK